MLNEQQKVRCALIGIQLYQLVIDRMIVQEGPEMTANVLSALLGATCAGLHGVNIENTVKCSEEIFDKTCELILEYKKTQEAKSTTNEPNN